jgi:dTDP-4-amino-4,6-dideoxygalactose transaminase
MIPVMRPWLGQEEAAAAADAVASGWIAQGPRVREFEEAFAAAIGTPHAVAVSSCTAALHLALIAAGIGPGDEVIVPSLSFIATANAVRYVGAQPVFADVGLATQNLIPQTVQPHLTRRTRAVILVDQAGVPRRTRDRGRRLRGRVRLPDPAGWCRRRAGDVFVSPAQAPHHRRRRHAHHF